VMFIIVTKGFGYQLWSWANNLSNEGVNGQSSECDGVTVILEKTIVLATYVSHMACTLSMRYEMDVLAGLL
jgi:hypothetical protein